MIFCTCFAIKHKKTINIRLFADETKWCSLVMILKWFIWSNNKVWYCMCRYDVDGRIYFSFIKNSNTTLISFFIAFLYFQSLLQTGNPHMRMYQFLTELRQKRKQCFRWMCASPPTDTQPQRHQVDSHCHCAHAERSWPHALSVSV